MTRVVGVDGRRGGWAVAVVTVDAAAADQDGAAAADEGGAGPAGRALDVTWHTVAGQDAGGFAAVLALARAGGAAAVGVDCPIGLPADGWRPCDLLAKRRLGAASARVFLAPPREVLAAPTYAEARAEARQVLGRGVSAQTYGIRRVVLAVDEALAGRAGDPADGDGPEVVEVHPELSFMAMAGRGPGDPLPSKRTGQGRAARLAALAGWAGEVEAPEGDDHLDALAAAWSAARWVTGTAVLLGGEPDAKGLPMRIVV